MSQEWFYNVMDQIAGPFTSSELREHARVGRIQPDDFIRRGTNGSWVSVESVKEFFDPHVSLASDPNLFPPNKSQSSDPQYELPEDVHPVSRGPQSPAAKSSLDRIHNFLTKRVTIPTWVLCLFGVLVLQLIIFVVVIGKSNSPNKIEEARDDDYLVTGVEEDELGLNNLESGIHIEIIKNRVKHNADDPESIQWIEFRVMTKEESPGVIPNSTWIVWYRARNKFNALQINKDYVLFKIRTDSKGKEIATFEIASLIHMEP